MWFMLWKAAIIGIIATAISLAFVSKGLVHPKMTTVGRVSQGIDWYCGFPCHYFVKKSGEWSILPEALAFDLFVWTLIAFVILLLARLRKSDDRQVAGQCAACGYDLTGNTSGICPECAMPTGAQGNQQPPTDNFV
jgi:hypothetical protein